MPTGKVKWFDAEKGFGFLSQEDGPDVYVRSEALPEGVTTLKSGTRVEFGIAQGRRGDQALQVRVLDAPASVARNKSAARRKKPDEMAPIVEDLIRLLDGVGETYRHGRHPDGADREAGGEAAARAGRRARALGRGAGGATGTPGASCGARVPSTNTVQATSTIPATPRPRRGISGIAMPTNPPITQASCTVVSLRAKALAWTWRGTPSWIVASRDSLASDWASPAVSPSATSVNSP